MRTGVDLPALLPTAGFLAERAAARRPGAAPAGGHLPVGQEFVPVPDGTGAVPIGQRRVRPPVRAEVRGRAGAHESWERQAAAGRASAQPWSSMRRSVAQAQGAVAFVEVVVAAGAQRDEVGESGEVAEPPGDDVVGDGAGVVAAVDGAGRSPSGAEGSSFGAVGHASGGAGADGGAEGVEQDGVELAVAAQALQGLGSQGGGAAVGQDELGGEGAEAAFDGGEGGDDGQVRRVVVRRGWWWRRRR